MKSTNKIYGVDASGNQIDVLEALANSTFSSTGTYPDLTAGNATNATTASKLSVNAGTATNPIYFSGGVPVQCGSSLAVSVTGTAAGLTGDVVTGQTVSNPVSGTVYINCILASTGMTLLSLSSGAFINCTIQHAGISTGSGGELYFYACTFTYDIPSVTISANTTIFVNNCKGAFSVSNSSANVYLSNCPNLTISGTASSVFNNVYITNGEINNWTLQTVSLSSYVDTSKFIINSATAYKSGLIVEVYVKVQLKSGITASTTDGSLSVFSTTLPNSIAPLFTFYTSFRWSTATYGNGASTGSGILRGSNVFDFNPDTNLSSQEYLFFHATYISKE